MASVEEITAQLERQLEEANRKIDDFVRLQSDALAKAAKDHEEAMKSLEDKINRLAHDESSAVGKVAQLQRELEAERAQLSNVHTEVSRLETTTRSIPVEVDATRAAEAAARAQLAQQKSEFDRREKEVKFQLNELTKGVAFYKRLGLEFEKIDAEKLKLVFTQIDSAHPLRPFSFNVRISAGDAYEVDGVDPPAAGVDELVRQLNADNDFSKFVQLMRQAFVQAATSSGV